MPRDDDRYRLRHMLQHAREAVALVEGGSKTEFLAGRVIQLAVERLVEIVGEASARISEDEQRKTPDIPWEDVVGMRHKLVHGYGKVDLNLRWDTLTADLPPLIAAPETILQDGGQG